jgi:hypothetical protein
LALCSPERAVQVAEAMVQRWQQEGVTSRGEVLGLQHRGSTWQTL